MHGKDLLNMGNIALEERLNGWTKKLYNKEVAACSNEELYYSILNVSKEMMNEKPVLSGDKKVYYISMEFLIGKLLSNNLINLNVYDELAELLAKNGKNPLIDVSDIFNINSLFFLSK